MATTLPTYRSQPAWDIFQTQAVYFDGIREPYPAIDNMSNTAPASAVVINLRQTSMFSVLSVASAPLQPRNNKNRSAYDVLPTPSAKRPIVMPGKAYHTVVAHDAIPSHHSSLLVFWPRL